LDGSILPSRPSKNSRAVISLLGSSEAPRL
jgi:hypothetical protein